MPVSPNPPCYPSILSSSKVRITSHLPVSQHRAEPGMEETVHGCLPMTESKSGQGPEGKRKAGMGQCWPEPVRDPIKKGLPYLCMWQEVRRRAQPWLREFGKTLRTLPGLAGNYRRSGLVKHLVPWELSQGSLPHWAVVFGGI